MNIIDVTQFASGKPSFESFSTTIAAHNWEQYRGHPVQMKGCVPSWAHLMVMGRLVGVASKVEFVIDDGKGGRLVPVYPL